MIAFVGSVGPVVVGPVVAAGVAAGLVTANDAAPAFSWWVLAPTMVMLSVAVAAAPIWPWSREWGWPVAGIFGVAAGTAALFTTAWWFS